MDYKFFSVTAPILWNSFAEDIRCTISAFNEASAIALALAHTLQVRSASAINRAGRLVIYREWRSPED